MNFEYEIYILPPELYIDCECRAYTNSQQDIGVDIMRICYAMIPNRPSIVSMPVHFQITKLFHFHIL